MSKKTKLTAVSMTYRGKTAQRFVQCEVVNVNGKEKTICPPTVLESMQREVGCVERGTTFTFG